MLWGVQKENFNETNYEEVLPPHLRAEVNLVIIIGKQSKNEKEDKTIVNCFHPFTPRLRYKFFFSLQTLQHTEEGGNKEENFLKKWNINFYSFRVYFGFKRNSKVSSPLPLEHLLERLSSNSS